MKKTSEKTLKELRQELLFNRAQQCSIDILKRGGHLITNNPTKAAMEQAIEESAKEIVSLFEKHLASLL